MRLSADDAVIPCSSQDGSMVNKQWRLFTVTFKVLTNYHQVWCVDLATNAQQCVLKFILYLTRVLSQTRYNFALPSAKIQVRLWPSRWGTTASRRVLRVADGWSLSRGDPDRLCRILRNKAPRTDCTLGEGKLQNKTIISQEAPGFCRGFAARSTRSRQTKKLVFQPSTPPRPSTRTHCETMTPQLNCIAVMTAWSEVSLDKQFLQLTIYK